LNISERKEEKMKKETIKKIKTEKICEWCWTDLKEKIKADYVIIFRGGKEYICSGHKQSL
jgi:hypothetical protein